MAKPKKRIGEPIKASKFLDALKFCQLVTKPEGAPFDTHVLLKNHWAIAFNGVLAVGQKIEEDINAAPNSSLMYQALAKCGDTFSITQLNNDRISVKSNKFKAMVPCIDIAVMSGAIPDAPLGAIDDRFKTAIEAVSGIQEGRNPQQVIHASVLMAGGSIIATDAKVMIEFWHGIDLPIGIALPKSFGAILSKCDKKLTKFGFSKSSVTFYFEDESWIRTQFFAEPWPDVRNVLDKKSNAWPVPNDFWKALDAVEPFSETGDVYFDQGLLRSHDNEGEGASYEVFGIPKGPIFSAKQLNIIRPFAKMIDFQAPGIYDSSTMLMFFGDNCRGAIAGRSK